MLFPGRDFPYTFVPFVFEIIARIWKCPDDLKGT